MNFIFIIFKNTNSASACGIKIFILNYNLFKFFSGFFTLICKFCTRKDEAKWKRMKAKVTSRMWLQNLLHYSSINQWSKDENKM